MHVITGLGVGGAERALVQLATALQSREMPQHVVSMGERGHHAGVLEAAGVGVTALGIRSSLNALGGCCRLAALVSRERPDVLQGWMYHGNVLAALAHRLVPGRRSRRLMWNVRASNVDDKRYGRIVKLNAMLSSVPDIVIANSQVGINFHLGHGFHPRRIEIIPNGIDTNRFRPDPAARRRLRAELGIASDSVVAIHIARADPMKDHATFLTAMARLPGIIGLLVGAGTQEMSLPSNVQALGQRNDVEGLVACADIVVCTSAFAEGFSNALAEGMSAGLIPIATDVGDARLIVGDTGSIIRPRQVAELENAIAAQAAKPLDERQRQGLRTRTRIVENFALQRFVERFAMLYAAA
jgi:glycosyltransferase involved in cell wall biosynthesis